LPGCEKDAEIFHNLLCSTGKFNDILFINKEMESSDIKLEITNFIKRHREGSVKVDEFLLYYSGHGNFDNNEFYYILPDYDSQKINKTSIQNSELDTWIRSINPSLTIKIVDACHSGVTYVKEDDSFEKYLNSTQNIFNKCYFMFSSYLDQSSYITGNLSDFTKSFINSISEYKGTTLRYKDIIDFISDDFAANPRQKPFFVIQADMTEEFFTLTKEIKAILLGQKDFEPEKEDVGNGANKLQLLEIIRKDSEQYCSKEEVMSILNDTIKDHILKFNYSPEIKELYEIDISFNNSIDKVPQLNVIGKWLDDNQNDYFVSITYETESYTQDVEAYDILRFPMYYSTGRIPTKTVVKYREIISGYTLTADSPFSGITLSAKPIFPNIPWSTCMILPIFSKTDLRLFYAYSLLKEKNWEERDFNKNVEWKTSDSKLKYNDKLLVIVNNILVNYDNYLIEFIKQKFQA
jgi:hypothetical protein